MLDEPLIHMNADILHILHNIIKRGDVSLFRARDGRVCLFYLVGACAHTSLHLSHVTRGFTIGNVHPDLLAIGSYSVF